MSKIGKFITVVKAFVFSHPGTPAIIDPATGKISVHATPGYTKEFPVGEQEPTPEMIDHPWVIAGADGAIETEEMKAAREKAAKPDPVKAAPAPEPAKK
jgi:hypothetical protein